MSHFTPWTTLAGVMPVTDGVIQRLADAAAEDVLQLRGVFQLLGADALRIVDIAAERQRPTCRRAPFCWPSPGRHRRRCPNQNADGLALEQVVARESISWAK